MLSLRAKLAILAAAALMFIDHYWVSGSRSVPWQAFFIVLPLSLGALYFLVRGSEKRERLWKVMIPQLILWPFLTGGCLARELGREILGSWGRELPWESASWIGFCELLSHRCMLSVPLLVLLLAAPLLWLESERKRKWIFRLECALSLPYMLWVFAAFTSPMFIGTMTP